MAISIASFEHQIWCLRHFAVYFPAAAAPQPFQSLARQNTSSSFVSSPCRVRSPPDQPSRNRRVGTPVNDRFVGSHEPNATLPGNGRRRPSGRELLLNQPDVLYRCAEVRTPSQRGNHPPVGRPYLTQKRFVLALSALLQFSHARIIAYPWHIFPTGSCLLHRPRDSIPPFDSHGSFSRSMPSHHSPFVKSIV